MTDPNNEFAAALATMPNMIRVTLHYDGCEKDCFTWMLGNAETIRDALIKCAAPAPRQEDRAKALAEFNIAYRGDENLKSYAWRESVEIALNDWVDKYSDVIRAALSDNAQEVKS